MTKFPGTSHTPPGKKKGGHVEPLATARAIIEAEAVRGHAQPTRAFIKRSQASPDGLPQPTNDDRLLALDPIVRYSLWMRELQSLVAVKPTAGNMTAELQIKDGNGSWTTLHTFNRPSLDQLIHGSPSQFESVVQSAQSRISRIDGLVAHDAELVDFFLDLLGIDDELALRATELITIVSAFVFDIVQELKYHFNVPRPSEVAPTLTTALPVPMHSSFPSGHSAQAMAIAVVLTLLAPSSSRTKGLTKLAHHIGEGRVIAGLHYPIDNEIGGQLGVLLGLIVFAAATTKAASDAAQRTQITTIRQCIATAPRLKALVDEAQKEIDKLL
jgi:hypothetical protein